MKIGKLKKIQQWHSSHTPQTLHSHSADGTTLLECVPEAGNGTLYKQSLPRQISNFFPQFGHGGGMHFPSVLLINNWQFATLCVMDFCHRTFSVARISQAMTPGHSTLPAKCHRPTRFFQLVRLCWILFWTICALLMLAEIRLDNIWKCLCSLRTSAYQYSALEVSHSCAV